jgi:hypothetical protein
VEHKYALVAGIKNIEKIHESNAQQEVSRVRGAPSAELFSMILMTTKRAYPSLRGWNAKERSDCISFNGREV